MLCAASQQQGCGGAPAAVVRRRAGHWYGGGQKVCGVSLERCLTLGRRAANTAAGSGGVRVGHQVWGHAGGALRHVGARGLLVYGCAAICCCCCLQWQWGPAVQQHPWLGQGAIGREGWVGMEWGGRGLLMLL